MQFIKKNHRTAHEWMEFYEQLFKERHPVEVSPEPLVDDKKKSFEKGHRKKDK